MTDMINKQVQPKETCPFCHAKLVFEWGATYENGYWKCPQQKPHAFCGPDADLTGEGVDKLIRNLRREIIEEANNG